MDCIMIVLILVLELLINLLPIFFLIVYIWSFFFLLMPINLHLQTEEHGLHSLADGYVKSTMQMPSKGYQRPPKTSDIDANKDQDTAASDGELQHPEECSSDSEDGTDTTDPVAQCSNEEGSPQLVVVAPTMVKQYDTPVLPVVTSEPLNAPEPPPIVREVPLLPTAKGTSLPTVQELQYNDKKDQDSCCDDDSEPEDEDDGSYDETHSDSLKMEEKMILQGPILRQSSEPDTKSDQEDKNEVMPIVKESRTVIESDSNFAPCVASAEDLDMKVMNEEVNTTVSTGSTEKADQKHLDEEFEVNSNKRKKPTSIVPSNSTCKQSSDAVDQISRETEDNNSGHYEKTFPDCTTPND